MSGGFYPISEEVMQKADSVILLAVIKIVLIIIKY